MLAHLRAAAAAMARRQTARRRLSVAAALATLTSACAAPPPAPLAGADPSDPSARVSAQRYRSTLGPYTSQRPVEPASWLGEQGELWRSDPLISSHPIGGYHHIGTTRMADSPIDLAHLGRYTGGDRTLNAEILKLFDDQLKGGHDPRRAS